MSRQISHRGNLGSKLALSAAVGLGAWWTAKHLARVRRRIDVAGRTVLITGGSRGLGLAIAREFARLGADVAVCARSADELARAEVDLTRFGHRVQTVECDLTSKEQVEAMIREVEARFGGIDILVNNAGTIIVGPEVVMTTSDYEHAMAVNFWAAVHTIQATVGKMRDRGAGRIVNIASIGGKMPVPHLLPYCASKFALVGFSSGLRAELAGDGILVTTVNPGLMNTGSPRNANFKGNHQAEYAWFSVSDALPGISMSAEKAARLVVDATIHGDAEIILSLPAKLAARVYGLAPATFSEIASWIAPLLPSASREVSTSKLGRDSESRLTRSFLRHRGHLAEKKFGQL